jgi:hypothetical protein
MHLESFKRLQIRKCTYKTNSSSDKDKYTKT